MKDTEVLFSEDSWLVRSHFSCLPNPQTSHGDAGGAWCMGYSALHILGVNELRAELNWVITSQVSFYI